MSEFILNFIPLRFQDYFNKKIQEDPVDQDQDPVDQDQDPVDQDQDPRTKTTMKIVALFLFWACFVACFPDMEDIFRRIEDGEMEPEERFAQREKIPGDPEDGDFEPLIVVGDDIVVDLDGDIHTIDKTVGVEPTFSPPPARRLPVPAPLPPPPPRPIHPAPVPDIPTQQPPPYVIQVVHEDAADEPETQQESQIITAPKKSSDEGYSDVVLKLISFFEAIFGISISAVLFGTIARIVKHYKDGARGLTLLLLLAVDIVNKVPAFRASRVASLFRVFVTGRQEIVAV